MPPNGEIAQWLPSPAELDDLELLLLGIRHGHAQFAMPKSVASTPSVDLLDPEGVKLARFEPLSLHHSNEQTVVARGRVVPLAQPTFGPFRNYRLSPASLRQRHPGQRLLAVPIVSPLSAEELESISKRANESDSLPVLLACIGAGNPEGLTAEKLILWSKCAARRFECADVVAVAARRRLERGGRDRMLTEIGTAFGDHVMTFEPREAETESKASSCRDGMEFLAQRGMVIFFTGLSGSGKSTLARALYDHLVEKGRTVTTLDGDIVRRLLSSDLGFSPDERERNVRRIGWVAAEISRHGGVAICAPIAPYGSTRREVREMVERAGGSFVLVHVATPLDECERRDRKGLYAQARAGTLADFTGVGAPYEVPSDAHLVIDTTGRTVMNCLDVILSSLDAMGLNE